MTYNVIINTLLTFWTEKTNKSVRFAIINYFRQAVMRFVKNKIKIMTLKTHTQMSSK